MKFYLTIICCITILGGLYLGATTETALEEKNTPPPSFRRAIENKFHEKQPDNQQLRCSGVSLTAQGQTDFYRILHTLQTKKDLLVLVDPTHVLPQDYKPQDLVTQTSKKWPKKAVLRQEAMEHMNAMIAAAKKDGITLSPISTYRTWQYQNGLYQRNLARNGGRPTGYVARAGESQHHLGTAVDFNTVNPKDENIPALVWLREHAGEYGFSLSFPKGAEAEKERGYPYEAWHYRYITPEAVILQDNFFGGSQHKTLKFLHDCIFKNENAK